MPIEGECVKRRETSFVVWEGTHGACTVTPARPAVRPLALHYNVQYFPTVTG